PLFDAPQFPLVLPNARTRNGVGQTVKDLSEDPYAGADVTLTLTAKDEAGNEGRSEPFNMRLPERLFTKPLARVLIEQRRILALERGASDEEIKKLTENLRAALDKFMRQLAEQLRNNPQQLARPLDPNTRVMRQQDLDNMIERMERLSRSGDKEAAKQLLEQLQQMLENLQMAQPGQSGDADMEQA